MGYVQTNSDQSLKTKLITQRVIPLAKLTQILADYNRYSEMPLAAYLIKNNYLTKEKILEVMPNINPDDLVVPMASLKNEFASDYVATMTNDLPNFLSNDRDIFNNADNTPIANDLFAQNQDSFDLSDNTSGSNDLFASSQEPVFDNSVPQNDLFAQNQDNFDLLNNAPAQNNLFSSNQEPVFDNSVPQNDLFAQNQDNFDLLNNAPAQNDLMNQDQDKVTFFNSGLTQNDIFTQNQNNFDLLNSMPEQNDISNLNDTPNLNDTAKDNFATTQQQTGFMDLISETHIEPPKSADLELDFADAAPKKVEPKANEKKSESKIIPFGKACILLHFTTQENVDEALQIQRTESPQKKLGEIMVEKGMIAPDKVKTVLERQQVRSMICTKCNKTYKIVLYQASKKYKCKVCSSNLVLEEQNTNTIKVDKPKAPTQFIGLTQEIPLQVRPPQQQEPELDFAEDYVAPTTNNNANVTAPDNAIHNINVFQPVERTETILEKVGIDVNQLRDYGERNNSYQQALTQRRMKSIAIVAGIVLVIVLFVVFSSSGPKRTIKNANKNNSSRKVQQSSESSHLQKTNQTSRADLEKEWAILQEELDRISEERNKLEQDDTIDDDVNPAKLFQKWSSLIDNCKKVSNTLEQLRQKGEHTSLELQQIDLKLNKALDFCQTHMIKSIEKTLEKKLEQASHNILNFSARIQASHDFLDSFYQSIEKDYKDLLPKLASEIQGMITKSQLKIEAQSLEQYNNLQIEISSILDSLSKIPNSKKFDKLNELKQKCEYEKTMQLTKHVSSIKDNIQKIDDCIKEYELYKLFNEHASKLYSYIRDYKFDYALKYMKNTLSKKLNEETYQKWENELQEYSQISNEMWRIFRYLYDNKMQVELSYDNGKKIVKTTSTIQSFAQTSKTITIGQRKNIKRISLDHIAFDSLTHLYNLYNHLNIDSELVYCFLYIGKKLEEVQPLLTLKSFSKFHERCILFYTIQEILLCTSEVSDENTKKIIELIVPLDKEWGLEIYYQYSAEELAKSVQDYIRKASKTKRINELGEIFNTYLSSFLYNSDK